MNPTSPCLILGASGLVGGATKRLLKKHENTLLCPTHRELDLCNLDKTMQYFYAKKPEYVIICAGKVGGLPANNKYPAEFAHENALIVANTLRVCWLQNVKKAIYLGSSCIYPRECKQPMKEEYLMTGPLEPTNSGYAMAKLLGIELCKAYHREYGCNYISLIPSNVYGPGDNFNPLNAHCLPSMISRMSEAIYLNSPAINLLGTGQPTREWLYVDDLAAAIVWAMDNYDDPTPLNVGSGTEISILDLAILIANTVGYEGIINFNCREDLDGMPRKLVDTSRINKLGWQAKMPLRDGIEKTVKWYLDHK